MIYFLQDWIVNPMLNFLKRTMTYPGFGSSQHTQPLHHLGSPQMFHGKPKNLTISREQACSISVKTV
jgi:hypothetical protein